MIMAIYASATPGHTQKELTADLTLWAQMLVPRSLITQNSSLPPPGLVDLPTLLTFLALALCEALRAL